MNKRLHVTCTEGLAAQCVPDAHAHVQQLEQPGPEAAHRSSDRGASSCELLPAEVVHIAGHVHQRLVRTCTTRLLRSERSLAWLGAQQLALSSAHQLGSRARSHSRSSDADTSIPHSDASQPVGAPEAVVRGSAWKPAPVGPLTSALWSASLRYRYLWPLVGSSGTFHSTCAQACNAASDVPAGCLRHA